MTWKNVLTVATATIVAVSVFVWGLVIVTANTASATWKPQFGKSPKAVQLWFQEATVPGWPDFARCLRERTERGGPDSYQQNKQYCGAKYSPAYLRLGIAKCCKEAERLRTKFVPSVMGTNWAYFPDPKCTHAGCPLLPIPNDIVHPEPVRALDSKDDGLPEFDAMRREGVLFIYEGAPSCFWAPNAGG